jgi:hypothetical protein
MASEGSQRCRRVMSLIVFCLCAAEPRPLMTHLAGFEQTQTPNFRGHTQPQRLGSVSALEMTGLGSAWHPANASS